MNKFIKHLKKYYHHYIISLVLITSLFLIFYSISTKESAHLYEVQEMSLESTISFAGSVVPSGDVDLSFESSGKVKFAPYEKDDSIKKGAILASLDDTKLQSQLEQTKANIKEAKSNLEKLKSPAKIEEIVLQESKINSYEVDILNTKEKLIDTYRYSYITADNSIRGYTDQMFTGPSTSPNLIFDTNNNNQEIAIEKNRLKIENKLIDWKVKTVYIEKSNVIDYLILAKEDLQYISNFLSDLSIEVNNLEPSSSVSSSETSSWRSNLILSRNNIETAISSITTQLSSIDKLMSALAIEEKNLDLIKAPAKREEIDVYEARILSLEALLKNYESNIDGLKIISPIDGIISKYDITEGQSVSAYNNVVSVVSDSPLEIEASLSELDVPYVKVGNTADITFDSYGEGVSYKGVIKSMDDTETLINNLPTYKVEIEIFNQDEKILSGMSAEIKSVVWQKENAISIPISSVKTEGDDIYVLKMNSENVYEKTKIEVSNIADGGYVEVIKGLSLGDFIKLKYND